MKMNKEKKMKILLYNDDYDEVGGGEIYIKQLHKKLIELDYNAFIFAFAKEEDIGGYTCVYKKKSKTNKFSRFLASFIFDIRAYRLFRKCIEKIQPDIIHINHNNAYTNSILLAAKQSGIPVVNSICDYTVICPIGWCVNKELNECDGGFGMKCRGCMPFFHFMAYLLFYPLKIKFMKRVIKNFIVGGKRFAEKLRENGFKNVFWLPYFVNSSYRQTVINVKKEKNLILFVGRFVKEKGLNYLIDAMPEIIKKNNKARLVVVGDGIMENELKEKAERLGMKNYINFIGRLSYEELHKYYKKASVIVVPSIWMEQFNLNGIEAMQYGTPAVGHKIGGIPEWLHDNKNGFLIEPRDHKQMAQRIIEILGDDEMAERFGKYGMEMVNKNYDFDEYIRKLEEIYENTCSGRNRIYRQ